MALQLSTLLTAARDVHPAFRKERVPDAVLARFLTGYQRQLLSLATQRQREFLVSQASIAFDVTSSNAVGTAGAGTTGGMPGTVSGGSVTADQLPAGTAIELDFADAPVMVSERVVSSATSTTLVYTGAGWTVNAYQNKYVWITAGKGQGQKRLVSSNTSDTLTISQAWSTIPDTTSVFEVVNASASASEEVGVAVQLPATSTRVGYLVRLSANGAATLDLTQPLVATFDVGIGLPPMKYLLGGTVRFTSSDAVEPLTLVSYASRLQPAGAFPAYLMNGELFLIGDENDWHDVASIDLRFVPEPPALTALTDYLVLPDSAYSPLVARTAAFAGQRVMGLPEADGLDLGLLLEAAAGAEMVWLNEISSQKRSRVSRVRDVF